MLPKVSVITVCYNCADDLRVTLQNVADLEYQNLECVVIDGASNDSTPEVLKSFESTINVLISEPDEGIYDAMNKGIKHASGEWLIFMNAGDTFASKDVIDEVFSQLEPSTDFLYGDRYRVETDGSISYQSAGSIEDTLQREVVYHQALFTRAELLKQRAYSRSYRLAADFEYVVNGYSRGLRFQHVELPICNFMCGGRSRQQHIRAMIEAMKVIVDHQADSSQWNRSDVFRHFIQNHMEFVVGLNLQDFIADTENRKLEILNDSGQFRISSTPSHPQIEHFFDKVLRPLSHPATGFGLPKTRSTAKPFRPVVTVVTVVFNDAEGLMRTINSTQSQDYQNIEYVVVDGGSTDETAKVLETFKDSFDKYISEPDEGIYDAMNKAIGLATGDFVIFMNAGDVFASSGSVSAAMSFMDDGVDVLYGDRNYLGLDGSLTHQPAKPMDTVFQRMPYCHQAVFVKLSVLRKHPFNQTYKFAADYNQVVEMYRSGYTFKQIKLTICNFAEGGKSESGVRPYLEVMKIQYDNAPKGFKPSESEYVRAFRNNVSELLGDS